jgi:hypothetical protein
MEKFATSHHANFPASSYSFVKLTKWLCIVCWVLPLNISIPNFEHRTTITVCIQSRILLFLYNPNPLDGRAFVSCCMFETSNGFSPPVLWGFVVVQCYGSTNWTLPWTSYKGDRKKNFERWCTSYMQGKFFLNLHMFDLHHLVFILEFFVTKFAWLSLINHHNG